MPTGGPDGRTGQCTQAGIGIVGDGTNTGPEDLTLSSLVQAAWSVLVSRYSGKQDVVFGLTVSGRPSDLPGVSSMVGMFINTIPARSNLSSATSTLELIPEAEREAERFRSTMQRLSNEVHKVVVGPVDNNVFFVYCKRTGESIMIDAANEHELLLELCQRLFVHDVVVLATAEHADR